MTKYEEKLEEQNEQLREALEEALLKHEAFLDKKAIVFSVGDKSPLMVIVDRPITVFFNKSIEKILFNKIKSSLFIKKPNQYFTRKAKKCVNKLLEGTVEVYQKSSRRLVARSFFSYKDRYVTLSSRIQTIKKAFSNTLTGGLEIGKVGRFENFSKKYNTELLPSEIR